MLSYGEVFSLFAHMHQVALSKHTAFRGRLQHFQKLGFPEGVNTGRGRPAEYGPEAVASLAFALELTQMGLNPERAIALMNGHKWHIRNAFGLASRDLSRSGHDPVFVYFDPLALASFSGVDLKERAGGSLSVATWSVLKRDIDKRVGFWRRLALVNVSTLVVDLTGAVAQDLKVATQRDFKAALIEWSERLPSQD